MVQSLASARSAFNQGAYAQAASLYGRALKRAEVMDDPEEIANAAYDYAAAQIQAGRVDLAAAALREAESEAVRAGQRVTDILLLGARVARLQGRDKDAAALADRGLADPASTTGDKVQAWLVKGHLAVGGVLQNTDDAPAKMDEAHVAAAEEAIGKAKALVGAQGLSPAVAMSLAELEGELAIAKGEFKSAGGHFDRAVDFARRGHFYGDMRRGLIESARAFAWGGDFASAGDRQFRAARSAIAENDPEGRSMIDRASKYAEEAKDAALIEKTAAARKGLPTKPQ